MATVLEMPVSSKIDLLPVTSSRSLFALASTTMPLSRITIYGKMVTGKANQISDSL